MSSTDIQLKKSGETGNTPSDLSYGEVAINYADGKLYYKSDTGVIKYINNQDTFGTISANGELVLALSPTDVLTINPGHAQSIVTDTNGRALTFAVDESQITSFVKKSGDTMTGDLYVNTANVEANYIIVETTLYSGLATRSSTPLPNLIAQFTGNTDSYVQVNAQNIDPQGSADFVVTADIGHDDDFYIDMGINNSQFDNSDGQTAEYPLDGYLVVQGSAIGQAGGNLVIGTVTTGTEGLNTKIVAGGSNEENIVAVFGNTEIIFNRDLVVNGNIYSPTITNLETEIQTTYNTANIAYQKANDAYNLALTGGAGANNVVLFHFPLGDYGLVTEDIYGGLGLEEMGAIFDMRTDPIKWGTMQVDLGFIS
jgi:hypothetical protein